MREERVGNINIQSHQKLIWFEAEEAFSLLDLVMTYALDSGMKKEWIEVRRKELEEPNDLEREGESEGESCDEVVMRMLKWKEVERSRNTMYSWINIRRRKKLNQQLCIIIELNWREKRQNLDSL